MNNYEYIKQISVDKLVKTIISFNNNSLCDYCVGCEFFDEDEEDICEKGLKEWLLQEVEQ